MMLVVLVTTGAATSASSASTGTPRKAAASTTNFTVSVTGGYGSGSYAPGSVVHVWSAASTLDEVVLPWSGDDELLDEPAEWHTSFLMPARNVDLVSNSKPAGLDLTVEQFKGRTDKLKTVRYSFPPSMRGVVLMSHGTGWSSNFIDRTETLPLALALVDAGYGVISTEAEEVAAGDLNGDGKIRWRTNYSTQNLDLKNLESMFAGFQGRGLIPVGTPGFALGVSNGGAVSHFLGTVGDSAVASSFPHLRFNAVVSYCADATGTQSSFVSTTPSAWYLCGADDNPEVSNAQGRANEARLRGRGIPTDYLEHQPSPIYDERFARIDGISAATSKAMVDELRDAGFVGTGGFITTDGDQIAAAVSAKPSEFPVISSQAGAISAIRSGNIRFFDDYVDPPSAPFGSWAALVTRITLDLTGTPPTTADLTFWMGALDDGTKTKGDLVDALRTGADNTGNVDPVARLYRAFLGRTPDAGGLQFWVGRRRSGDWTLVRTADQFAASSEFIRKYGALTNRQYVTRIYTDVLGRPADQGGVDYWTRQLDLKRRSRGSVMVGFSESSEYRRKQVENTEVAVNTIFLLGRAPTASQVADWVTRQQAGTPQSVLAGELLDSQAYANHIIG